MFSLFKKKPAPSVRVKESQVSRFVTGLKVVTNRHDLKQDVSALQKRFQKNRDQIEDPCNPSATLAVYSQPNERGSFSYFVGDLVESADQPDLFSVVELPAGKYAYITIDFKDPSQLPFAVAKAKHYFFHKWLPTSGYRVKEDIESIEWYDRRSSIALASMELVFPLVEQS